MSFCFQHHIEVLLDIFLTMPRHLHWMSSLPIQHQLPFSKSIAIPTNHYQHEYFPLWVHTPKLLKDFHHQLDLYIQKAFASKILRNILARHYIQALHCSSSLQHLAMLGQHHFGSFLSMKLVQVKQKV